MAANGGKDERHNGWFGPYRAICAAAVPVSGDLAGFLTPNPAPYVRRSLPRPRVMLPLHASW